MDFFSSKNTDMGLTNIMNTSFDSFGSESESLKMTSESSMHITNFSLESSMNSLSENDCTKLRLTLHEVQLELKQSQNEVKRLGSLRDDIEAEVCQLTADLFEEAHSMVREANIKAAAAEKALKESQMKVEVLQAEVNALKLLLLATPSRPQITSTNSQNKSPNLGLRLFSKLTPTNRSEENLKTTNRNAEAEIDPVLLQQFTQWMDNPQLSRNAPFMERIFQEDIDPSLEFPNSELGLKVQNAVQNNCVYIEETADTLDKCALLDTTRLCRYRMKLNEENEWYLISLLCRNRITAVCDFLSYLRYIQLGLVKSSFEDIYWQIMKLRKQMILARLGLTQ